MRLNNPIVIRLIGLKILHVKTFIDPIAPDPNEISIRSEGVVIPFLIRLGGEKMAM